MNAEKASHIVIVAAFIFLVFIFGALFVFNSILPPTDINAEEIDAPEDKWTITKIEPLSTSAFLFVFENEKEGFVVNASAEEFILYNLGDTVSGKLQMQNEDTGYLITTDTHNTYRVTAYLNFLDAG